MDLLVTCIAIAIFSSIQIVRFGSSTSKVSVVTEDGFTIKQTVGVVPIGSNPERKREIGAFRKILKEFDLIR